MRKKECDMKISGRVILQQTIISNKSVSDISRHLYRLRFFWVVLIGKKHVFSCVIVKPKFLILIGSYYHK